MLKENISTIYPDPKMSKKNYNIILRKKAIQNFDFTKSIEFTKQLFTESVKSLKTLKFIQKKNKKL